MSGFSIATIELGNGRLGFCPLPGRSGDAARDIATMADWSPGIVVSTTGPDEMAAHGIEGLGSTLANMGIAWEHFPIDDFAVPDPSADWPGLAGKLHPVLDRGGGVLVHCLGGRGRSGMIVLRLMVERGEDARAALERLRRQRALAVETAGQFRWASGT